MRTIVANSDGTIEIIDQTELPKQLVMRRLSSLEETAEAIATMRVRGAPLIGVTAAFGLAMALRKGVSAEQAVATLRATRPTAVNLAWALERLRTKDADAAWTEAVRMMEEDVATCRAIGEHGSRLLSRVTRLESLQLMTHCNAGWLATIDHGTALAPVYQLHDAGVPVHVWVSETRPRNQGLLTAWELRQHGVPHTVIVDNAAGALLQGGKVDAVIVGTDRTTRGGDVVNKVGTYLKALAAREAGVPFYVAVPSSSIDWSLRAGGDVEIEHRAAAEVGGDSPVLNPGFDVTPAKLVTRLITERGDCAASEAGLLLLFPERAA